MEGKVRGAVHPLLPPRQACRYLPPLPPVEITEEAQQTAASRGPGSSSPSKEQTKTLEPASSLKSLGEYCSGKGLRGP